MNCALRGRALQRVLGVCCVCCVPLCEVAAGSSRESLSSPTSSFVPIFFLTYTRATKLLSGVAVSQAAILPLLPNLHVCWPCMALFATLDWKRNVLWPAGQSFVNTIHIDRCNRFGPPKSNRSFPNRLQLR